MKKESIASKGFSSKGYEGVFQAEKKNGDIYYRSSLTHRGKHISLGSYDNPESAHRAYLEGNLLLSNSAITLVQYTDSSLLSFEKWVCLLNFRDNNIYFSNPIYVGQKLFYYYLSPSHVLKFDMDDLFYYSSHKIMCRGNHYFVADYGMQVNIAGRYGIKNYGVCGVDYHFTNGDTTDFRRENIVIANTYHGVRSCTHKKTDCYSARIHINGNFLIGYYDTPVEAAIAYNKAIDILKKNGVTKNYVPNYVDEIPPSKYADLYSQLQISEKIIAYRP